MTPSRRCTLLAAAAMFSAAGAAAAADSVFALGPALRQGDFNALVDELGMAMAYAPFSPGETLGVTGFELGASLSLIGVDEMLWSDVPGAAETGAPPAVSRLMLRKDLPYGIDVGASYVSMPDSSVTMYGGELRKLLLDGDAVLPAVSIQGHASSLSGVDDLDLSTYGIDLGISKGFAMFTPYGGVGQVWYEASENAGLSLDPRDASGMRSYLGLRVGFLPSMNLTAQADFTSAADSYTLRLDLNF